MYSTYCCETGSHFVALELTPLTGVGLNSASEVLRLKVPHCARCYMLALLPT